MYLRSLAPFLLQSYQFLGMPSFLSGVLLTFEVSPPLSHILPVICPGPVIMTTKNSFSAWSWGVGAVQPSTWWGGILPSVREEQCQFQPVGGSTIFILVGQYHL